MKKLISILLVLTMVFSLAACGKTAETYDVEITLPAELTGQTTQESLDEAVKNGQVHTATRNEDGSVTYVMSKRQHEDLMNEVKEQLQEALDELVGSEEYSNFTKIEANSDYTHFTVTTKSTELGFAESFSSMMFYILGGMYAALNGTSDVEITVDYVNAETGEVIESVNSSDMGA